MTGEVATFVHNILQLKGNVVNLLNSLRGEGVCTSEGINDAEEGAHDIYILHGGGDFVRADAE